MVALNEEETKTYERIEKATTEYTKQSETLANGDVLFGHI